MIACVDSLDRRLRARLGDGSVTSRGGTSLDAVGTTVSRALEAARRAGVPQLNLNGSSHQLDAQLVALATAMANAVDRPLRWKHPWAEARDAEGRRRESVGKTGRRTGLGSRTSPGESIAHVLYEPNAEEHAQRLKRGLADTLAQPCSLDRPTPFPAGLEASLELVARAEFVLLLQTREVLLQPWTLLALYRAYAAGVPIICVLVEGAGYDFGAARQHLLRLEDSLDAAALGEMATALAVSPRGLEP